MPFARINLSINDNSFLTTFNYFDSLFTSSEYLSQEVVNIKNKNISSKDIYELVGVFPAKTTKNIIESGIINEFA